MNQIRRRSWVCGVAGVGAGCLFLALARAASPPPSEATEEGFLVDLDTHRLFSRLQGRGTPLVVIEPGLSETFRSWETIIPEVAKQTRVLVYDRAGYGRSDSGPMPRTSGQALTDLRRLLDKIGDRSRVVLVGHSLGGVHALIFADKFPDRLAGLVLLDPPPVDFVQGSRFPALRERATQATKQFQEMALAERKPGNERQAAFFEAVASEHQQLFEGASGREYCEVKGLEGIPLTVIASERPNPQFGDEAAAFQQFWIQSNERLSRLSIQGTFIRATNASHHIHRDDPQVVIRAITRLVETEQRRTEVHRTHSAQ